MCVCVCVCVFVCVCVCSHVTCCSLLFTGSNTSHVQGVVDMGVAVNSLVHDIVKDKVSLLFVLQCMVPYVG